jgi:hypothetical protein
MGVWTGDRAFWRAPLAREGRQGASSLTGVPERRKACRREFAHRMTTKRPVWCEPPDSTVKR